MTKIEQAEQELKETEQKVSAWLSSNLKLSQANEFLPLLIEYVRKTIVYSQDLVMEQVKVQFGVKEELRVKETPVRDQSS